MAKKTKKVKKEKKVIAKTKKGEEGAGKQLLAQRVLYKELTSFFARSNDFVDTVRGDWDEKEALLLGKLKDELTTSVAKSRVFDPRLSTIVLERSERVMAQNPTGRAYAISKDDIGKNKLMNLILSKYVQKNANAQFDFLIKCRLWDLYSLVYGVYFVLLDWRADNGYIGPDFWLIPIRDIFPQPGAVSIDECERVQVSTLKSIEWLRDLPKEGWQNVDELISTLEEGGGTTKEDQEADRRTFIEREYFSNVPKDEEFPMAEIITEYRKDRWITYSPQLPDRILRDIENPHKNNRLPIYAKYCFPLLDNIFGLGEFERGKTLQYAINSLINLYLDGVKMSIFPPFQINPDGVVASTIKIGAAEKWLVNRPGVDVVQTQISPQGLNTFQSTYSFLIAALMNQAGTTDVSTPKQSDLTMGKTPQAIRYLEKRESARDAWDRFMMEKALENLTKGMIELIVEKMEAPIAIRLFGEEIKEIAQDYPDIIETFESGKRGEIKIPKKLIKARYDYEIDAGSTMKRDPNEELLNITRVLSFVVANPQILQLMPAQAQQLGKEAKTIDLSELFKRWVIATGIQDWEKILVEVRGQEIGAGMNTPQFRDQEIARVAQQITAAMGGISNVPATEEG